MNNAIIDTHCHLDNDFFQGALEKLLAELQEKGVKKLVIPGYISKHWERIFSLCNNHKDMLFAAPGLHPLYLQNHEGDDLELLDTLCTNKKCVAVGEIGLDFYKGIASKTEQVALFISQIEIASKHALPLLIHSRKAHDQVFSILRKSGFSQGGIVHAFNGSQQQAEKFISMGFKLGFGGNITYDRATTIRHLASTLPLKCIVLETDAPDIPLMHRKGMPNSPKYLPEIFDTMVKLRGEPADEIARQIYQNSLDALPLLS